MRKMFIIGLERYPEQCVIQKIDLDNKKYLMPTYLRQGHFYSWIHDVVKLIERDNPTEVIFDESGQGYVFKELVEKIMKEKWNVYQEEQKMEDKILIID